MSDTPPSSRPAPAPSTSSSSAGSGTSLRPAGATALTASPVGEVLPPPARKAEGAGMLAPLKLDLGLHGVPGLVEAGEVLPPTDASPAPRGRIALTHADVALAARLFRRRAPVPLGHEGRTLRCVLLPEAAAPGQDGPWLSLTVAGRPAALHLGWSLARRLAGVPLDAVSPEDGALILEDALTPWLDAAEALLGIELRFLSLDRKPGGADGARLALGIEAAAEDAPGARQILPMRIDPAAAMALTAALDRFDRPREGLDGLWLRAAVEIEATRLAAADIASLQVGDALLIEGSADATAQVVVEEQLVAAAQPAPGAAGRAAWRLLGGFAPRGPLADHARRSAGRGPAAGLEESMSDTDDAAGAARTEPGGAPTSLGGTLSGSLAGLAGQGATDAARPGGEAGVAQDGAAQAGAAQDGADRAPNAGPSAAQSTPAHAAAEAPRAALSSIDRLEVRLSIRMGETMMTLAELRAAGPGTILTLDRPDGALVEIVANGQPIGTGEIISVSGQRAVEIRTLFADG